MLEDALKDIEKDIRKNKRDNKIVISEYNKYVKKDKMLNEERKNIILEIEKKELKKIKSNLKENGEFDWKNALNERKSYSYDLLKDYFKDNRTIDVSGHFFETKEYALQVSISSNEKEENLNSLENIINDYLKYTIPIKFNKKISLEYNSSNVELVDIKGFMIKSISIMEDDLSAGGSYCLVNMGQDWVIMLHQYSSIYQITNKLNLKDALIYIKDNISYN